MITNDVNKGKQLASFVPGDLVQQKFQYVFEVPIYQRVFTWGEAEFGRLISDLVKAFQDEDSKEDYYLGAITVVRKKKETNTLVLVDGQQRVTCVMLLGALFKWWGQDKIRIKYESRPKDMECLKRIYMEYEEHSKDPLNVGSIDTSKFENRAMRAFFDYIKRGNVDLELDTGEKKRNIEKFLKLGDRVKERLRLFVSYLPDNPYMSNLQAQNEYFEKMNSGGKQLEPEDILKVRICGKLGEKAFEEWNAISDFSKCYNDNGNSTNSVQGQCQQEGMRYTLLELVSSVDNISAPKKFSIEKEPDEGEERIPVRQGLIDFAMFLRHVFYIIKENDGIKDNDEIKAESPFSGSLLDTFATCENWDKNSCKTFLDKMQAYRKFLDDSVIHLKDEGGANGYYFYNRGNGDSKSLIAKDGSGQEVDGDSDRVLQLQSLLYVTSEEKQEWLLKLYEQMTGAQQVDVFSAVKKCLSDQLQGDVFNSVSSSTKIWPNSTKTEAPIGYGDVLKYGSKEVRLWLAFLDYLLWDLANKGCQGDKQNDLCEDGKIFNDVDKATLNAVKSYVFRRNRSVEHLHPQTDSNSAHREKWNTVWGGRTVKDFFGNLALISAGRNSEYRNESVGGKADRVRRLVESKSIESIKLVLMLKACDGKDEKWDPDCALEHAKSMLSVFKTGLKNLKERND